MREYIYRNINTILWQLLGKMIEPVNLAGILLNMCCCCSLPSQALPGRAPKIAKLVNITTITITSWLVVWYIIYLEFHNPNCLGVSEIRPEITPSFLFIWR